MSKATFFQDSHEKADKFFYIGIIDDGWRCAQYWVRDDLSSP